MKKVGRCHLNQVVKLKLTNNGTVIYQEGHNITYVVFLPPDI